MTTVFPTSRKRRPRRVGDLQEQAFRAAFPDLQLTIHHEIAEDDLVVHHWTMTGAHDGEFQGIRPTGKALTRTGITIVRVEDGKIVERWANVDVLGILAQLGVVPPPAL
jgi:predicted ester cyclase